MIHEGHIVVVGQWREGTGGRIPVPYLEAITAAGGRPLLASAFEPAPREAVPEGIDAVMGLEPSDDSPIDDALGLVLPGGGDIDPSWYGRPRHPETHNVNHRRDRFELTLLEEALHRDLPVLAICHGMQLLNVHLGGTLHQHLPMHRDHDAGAPGPDPVHEVVVEERSILARCLGATRIGVNSHHHQGLDEVAGVLEEVAWAEDGVLEAVVSRASTWVVGVQWHPEVMSPRTKPQARLFEAFVDATEAYARSSARATA
jgi:putative glutamine amidotransferase